MLLRKSQPAPSGSLTYRARHRHRARACARARARARHSSSSSCSSFVIAPFTPSVRSKLFNEFYHACPVIGSEQEAFRLALVEAFRQITKNATNLLGISLLEEM